MNLMSHGRILGILERLQKQITEDADEFERTLDRIEGVL